MRGQDHGVLDELSRGLVPDELWALVKQLIPPGKTRPQGGGMSRVDDRVVFTAIVFVLTSGCAWRHLPPSFGSPYRRCIAGSPSGEAGLWWQLHGAVLDELGGKGMIDWSRAVLDGASVRAKKGANGPARARSTAANPARRSTLCPTEPAYP
ncbi:putative transposase [Amycolatopsis methanolica 239]|uniref:Putative transposase n=1 Tax=Amycolatopsis methanolica 239 TaxID=1068978 RepID=A0A076N1U6_AMYME|nr:putative transposase [Amycolatopsis methanolica 239]